MVEFTLGQLAQLVGGTVERDGGLLIRNAATLDTAQDRDIAFATESKYASAVQASRASAVVVPMNFPAIDRPCIRARDARAAFTKIVMCFRPPRPAARVGVCEGASILPSAVIGSHVDIHPGARIADDVRIGSGCQIHANVCIMAGCRIGDDVTIFPGAVLYENTVIGSRVVIHAGSVLGAYGFGYDTVQGRHCRSEQLGFVEVEDDCEIGACTTIDRGTFGRTLIGEGTKIDNLVMIAHNCQIGKHNLICSQVGIAGSSTTGDYVVMAGQVGVPDHVRIGHRAVLGAKSGILRDVPDDTTVLGIPATPERDQLAKQVAFAKLPEMRRQLRELQRVVDRLVAGLPVDHSDAA
jgi:UDP-3-O-[3-hydroxymyristoyl] glucosamine N-acyltransferase